MTTRVETARNTQNFPNGATAITVTHADSDGADPPALTNYASVTVIIQGPGGANPPGYPDAFPGATLVPAP